MNCLLPLYGIPKYGNHDCVNDDDKVDGSVTIETLMVGFFYHM